MIVAAYEFQAGQKWHRLRCPNCHWSHSLLLADSDWMVECTHCHIYFSRLELTMMYPEIGGLTELNERQVRRLQLRRFAAGMRQVADELESEARSFR